VSDPAALTWLDQPPKAAWTEAIALLKRIDALDEAGRLTAHGAAVAKLPLPPRLAHMVAAAEEQDRYLAALLAVVLTEQGLGGRDADVGHRVEALMRDRGERARSARSLAARLAESAGGGESPVDTTRAGIVLALGFPERVAKARGVTQTPGARLASFLLANGRAAGVAEDDALARSQFIVVADASGTAQNARILSAAAIDEADVERLFADRIETHAAVKVDASGGLRGRRVRKLGRIVLSEAPLEKLNADEMSDALREAVRDEGLGLLDWSDTAQQTRARVALMRSLEGEAWPDWSDEALIDHLDDWLSLEGVRSLKDVDVSASLLNALPHDLRRRLEAEAPARFETPAGSSLLIDYTAEGGPALDVRLQEMFGQDVHPNVARGRVLLTLRLLSPAHRLVQATKDLPGFWRGSYAPVRSEMRGRYPKHPWPDDPISAQPTRRAKPRGS
jgi:ATP-dependent helicase HrpB